MNKRITLSLIYILPIPVMLASLFVGQSEQVSGADVFKLLINPASGSEVANTIVYNIRLPRILLVFITGGMLAISGSVMQAIFRNPLVDPYVLGLSSGAAFGAALGIAIAIIPIQLSAFLFGLFAVLLSWFMARKNKQVSIVSLILAGIITNGIFTSLLTIVQILADPFKLQSIVHWIMGNFQTANWDKFIMIIIPVIIAFGILFILRWKLNVLAMGDEEAASSGLNPERLKIWVLIAATLASSSVVAVSGIIGLYGLIIPHIVRMVYGVDNRQTIMINLLLGGAFLVTIDNFSRVMAGFEIPIGVFTMLIGAPFFIWILKKTNAGWHQ